jgi:hypothetical protein
MKWAGMFETKRSHYSTHSEYPFTLRKTCRSPGNFEVYACHASSPAEVATKTESFRQPVFLLSPLYQSRMNSAKL